MDTQVILILTSIDVHRKLLLALKSFQMVKITPPQVPITWQKKIPLSKIPLAGDFPLTHYCYLENPTMCKGKLLW